MNDLEIEKQQEITTKKSTKHLSPFNRSRDDIHALINDIGASGLIRATLEGVSRWLFSRGSMLEDFHIRLWMSAKQRKLFTVGIHNRLLSILRKKYDAVVLIKYSVIHPSGKIIDEAD